MKRAMNFRVARAVTGCVEVILSERRALMNHARKMDVEDNRVKGSERRGKGRRRDPNISDLPP